VSESSDAVGYDIPRCSSKDFWDTEYQSSADLMLRAVLTCSNDSAVIEAVAWPFRRDVAYKTWRMCNELETKRDHSKAE
jgi:hypothetical protein